MKQESKKYRLKTVKKAQAVLMYVLLIVVITAAGMASGVYIKRALQGRYKQTADVFGGGLQYEKGNTQIEIHRGIDE